MVEAPFDAYLDTPNKSIRQNVPRRGVCLHHGALLSLSELERLAMGAKQVSATAIAKDRISKRLMTDEFRAWSLSSAWGDSSFRSVETCNESVDGWTISDESHWELAYLVAYWAVLDGFWPHRDGDPTSWTVVGHREMYTIHGVSYATACPGGMDLNLVTVRAQSILNGTAPAGLTGRLIKELGDIDMRYFWAPDRGGFTDTLDNGPLYPANAEEATALSKAYNGLDITTREWDVLRQASLNRQVAAGKATSDSVNAAVNTAIDSALTGADVNVSIDVQAIAAATRAEFAKNPLK